MASIRTSIELYDQMSGPLNNITNALNMTVNSFGDMDSAMNSSFDSSSLDSARDYLNQANVELQEMEDNIRQADNQQQNLNDSLQEGTTFASGLGKKILGFVGAYAGLQGAKKTIGLSDEFTNITSRIDLMNDGLQTTDELMEMLFESAQRSRGGYFDTANAVAQLGNNAGDAFANTKEIVHFSELLNKQFVIAGTEQSGIAAATLQLTQAMGMGVLRGEELNSILEQAPNIVQVIADYMEAPKGEIKELASEGMITADVVKNAMFAATDNINEKFESMPMTFAQVGESIKNNALVAFQPILDRLNEIANSERFQTMVQVIISTISIVASVLVEVFDFIAMGINWVANIFIEYWDIIAPLLMALGTVLLAQIITKLWAMIPPILAQAGAWIVAHAPMLLVIGAIALIIYLYYKIIDAVNAATGSSISATGIVIGILTTLGQFIINLVGSIWNNFASLAEFFVNVWKHPVYSTKRLFGNLAINVLDMAMSISSGFDDVATNIANAFVSAANMAIGAINWIISGLNKIPGVDINKMSEMKAVSSITGTMQGWKDDINDWMGEQPDDYWEAPKFEQKSLSQAWDQGYALGEHIDDKVSNFSFSDLFDVDTGVSDMTDLMDIPSFDELTGYGGLDDKVPGKVGSIADDVGSMKDSMDLTQEDLKYLRDLAETEAVNRFTTAEIVINQNNENHINSEMDLDGVVDYFVEGLDEAIDIAVEGVH